MTRRRLMRFALCLLLLPAGLAAWGEFRVAPVDPELLEGNDGLMTATIMTRSSDVSFQKLPEGIGEIDKGRMILPGGRKLEFAGYRSKGNGGSTLDKIIFDLDGDKDLTDEKVYDLDLTKFTEITLKLPEGGTFRASYQGYPGMLRVRPAVWLKGTIEVEGRKFAAALIDSQLDGFAFSQQSDIMLVDRDGDGKFGLDIDSYDLSELSYLQSEMLLGGKLYEVDVDVDGEKPDVRLSPYEGPTGKLALDLQVPKKPKQYTLMTYTMEENRMNMVVANSADFPVEIKTGEFKPMMLMLVLVGKDGRRTMVQAETEQALSIEKGKTAILKLGGHGALELIVGEKSGSLSINQKLPGKDGISYSMIAALPEKTDDSFVPKGGLVKVFDMKGELLTEGALEYG